MKRETIALITGILTGASLFGGAAYAAEGIMAQRSTQSIYVDGAPVQMEAYAINGNNYVKLRDVGKTVGFNVYWDGTVQIDSDAAYTGEAPASAKATAAASAGKPVTLPTDGSKYIPKVGDLIPCDDGTLYEVKDTLRWENNVYSPGALPDLPTPACDWSIFPKAALPKVEARRFSDEYGDDLFVRNLYETRRMQYTIYNALGKEPSAWKDDVPMATVELTTPAEYEAYTAKFWPWRESEISDLVHSRPNSRYCVAAWDYYHDHIYQYTRYCILSL